MLNNKYYDNHTTAVSMKSDTSLFVSLSKHKQEPYLSVNGYSALIVFLLGLLCSSSFLSFLSCNLSTSDLIPPGVRVLR